MFPSILSSGLILPTPTFSSIHEHVDGNVGLYGFNISGGFAPVADCELLVEYDELSNGNWQELDPIEFNLITGFDGYEASTNTVVVPVAYKQGQSIRARVYNPTSGQFSAYSLEHQNSENNWIAGNFPPDIEVATYNLGSANGHLTISLNIGPFAWGGNPFVSNNYHGEGFSVAVTADSTSVTLACLGWPTTPFGSVVTEEVEIFPFADSVTVSNVSIAAIVLFNDGGIGKVGLVQNLNQFWIAQLGLPLVISEA